MSLKVAVFLSSSTQVSSVFLEEAFNLGVELAKAEITTVYGGANCGCMGRLADGVLSKKGKLVGVIPEMDFLEGLVHEKLDQKILVPTLSARKVRLIEESDAFIVFPGGIGTLDEVTEVLALNCIEDSAKAHSKPVIFYNHLGFWTPFLESLEIMGQQRMLYKPIDQLYQVFDTIPNVIGCIRETL